MQNILVSVLMPVYNSSRFLDTAIQSILKQTFTNFEFILIDDGSTDNSLDIIKSYLDPRIKVIVHEKNMGLIYTRNESVEIATGKYLAFLDSDDIALPQRLEKQVDFMERNPDYAIVGSWIKTIDINDNVSDNTIRYTSPPEVIPSILLFKNYFTTSSVIVRKSTLPEKPFQKDFPIAEDYNVWIGIADKHKVWNLQEVLIHYRVHNENISFVLKEKMIELDHLQLSRQLSKFNYSFSKEESDFYFLLGKTDRAEEYDLFLQTDFIFADSCFNKLITANNKNPRYEFSVFYQYISQFWDKLFVSIEKYHLHLFFSVKKSVFYKKLSISVKLKFLTKCLIGYKIK